MEIGYQTRAQFARREQHREQTALTCRDGEFGASKAPEMNVPVPEGTSRCWGFREPFRQAEPSPHALRTAQCQKNTGDWCELIKDIVAMANSGGGRIAIGANDDGTPSGYELVGRVGIEPTTKRLRVSCSTS